MEQVKIIGLEADSLKIELSGDIDLGNAEAFYQEVLNAYMGTPFNLFQTKTPAMNQNPRADIR